jgi:xanthine dehydrogenase accessory factor
MRELIGEIAAWRARGDRVAVATVVEVARSAPRPPGTKMAVSSSGSIAGAVSGGCVEGAVVEAAEAVLAGAPPHLLRYGSDEDPCGIGLPCGGEIAVWVQEFAASRFSELAAAHDRAAEVTLLTGPDAGARLVIEADGARSGTLGSEALDARAESLAVPLLWAEVPRRCGELFIDIVAPPPRLVIVGAGDITAALCTLADGCGWRTVVIDPRARYATAERFPEAEEVLAMWPAEAFARLGGLDPSASVVVLTHDPKLDDAALLPALASPARFVGAMGSRLAQAGRRERLLAAGLTDADLARLAAPVGLDLGASSVPETALSIFAEVVAVRHGRTGGPLARAAGRIHAVAA